MKMESGHDCPQSPNSHRDSSSSPSSLPSPPESSLPSTLLSSGSLSPLLSLSSHLSQMYPYAVLHYPHTAKIDPIAAREERKEVKEEALWPRTPPHRLRTLMVIQSIT